MQPIPLYRQATTNDLLAVCELGQQLNSLHHQERPDIYAPATEDFARDSMHWQPCINGERQVTFIAEQAGRAVGFVTVQVTQINSPLMQPQRVGRVGSVCVNDSARGQGIGRALMSLAQTWAIEQGATDLRLTVWAFNATALRLYEELGYEMRALEMGKRLDQLP
ncbi:MULTISPECIES: GNAT family N-acetyltransferase [unclassified Pseudomonas]|uniref:GNAT family N-acetyltransferase n=1 Tax=unclassified Pseudomonas TaxID=196821 RepID=UPI002AC966F0|nr:MULTISPECIES: GNAT family N-acetyltransferase [unclassified Pseudomonas]MEB0044915.1 GNAT family N-acetyltransferase [Pseudomonas sp. Dout3]MEB0096073.1 GNAT family N-acetyltransferase [Pseudomonas sp. DC1.2]WPX57935.1 GNAT family N-acetyltransferase [Pseudomonas sp. DC1.2]